MSIPKAVFPGAEKEKSKKSSGMLRFNRVKWPTNAIFTVLFIILALAAIIPVVFVVIISFSDEASIAEIGYSFTPLGWGITAYQYLWRMGGLVLRSFINSIGVTIVGTVLGLILTTTMGYTLSRRNYRFRKFFIIYIFIPMLFHGGLVSTYVVNTQLFGLMNTYLALILPLACSTFYIIILRTFFTTTVPDSIIESGKIDGASQLHIFVRLVLPISLPAIATIGLFLTFAYWNDWYQALLYLRSTHSHLYTLQYLLVLIERSIDFMAKNAGNISADSSAANMPNETMRMAIVVVIVLPIACSYPFFQKYFISGLTIGAVKG